MPPNSFRPQDSWRVPRATLELALLATAGGGSPTPDVLGPLLDAFAELGTPPDDVVYLRRAASVGLRSELDRASAVEAVAAASPHAKLQAFRVIARAIFLGSTEMPGKLAFASNVATDIGLLSSLASSVLREERRHAAVRSGRPSQPPPWSWTPPPLESPTLEAYRTLGLTDRAGLDEAKRAFRRLALELHPDRHVDADPAVYQHIVAHFQRVTSAYHTIVNAVV